MRSCVEPARRNRLRDNSEQAPSSHIDLRIQGEPDQSPVNEDQDYLDISEDVKNGCTYAICVSRGHNGETSRIVLRL